MYKAQKCSQPMTKFHYLFLSTNALIANKIDQLFSVKYKQLFFLYNFVHIYTTYTNRTENSGPIMRLMLAQRNIDFKENQVVFSKLLCGGNK